MIEPTPSSMTPAANAEENVVVIPERQFIANLFIKYRASLLRYLSRLVPVDDATELVQENLLPIVATW